MMRVIVSPCAMNVTKQRLSKRTKRDWVRSSMDSTPSPGDFNIGDND